MCVFTSNLLFLGHAITLITIGYTFFKNVYVLNYSFIMISFTFAGCILLTCIFILHPLHSKGNRLDTNVHVN